ncbi:MAG: response regulator transcription factor [Bacteroidales bacterium]
MERKVIKVLIVDDHAIVRHSLRAVLSADPDIEISGECCDGNIVIAFLEKNPVDVILMDIKMKHQNGIETTRHIKQQFPEIHVMGLSMLEDYGFIHQMLDAGADGYTIKTSGGDEIIKAVKIIYQGNKYFSAAIMQTLTRHKNKDRLLPRREGIRKSLESLTKREKEILLLISEEKTSKEISSMLGISTGTVSIHRKNLLRKLHVKNSIGLAKIACAAGLNRQKL